MDNPVQGVKIGTEGSGRRLRTWFWIALVSTLLLMAIMNVVGAPLATEAAPWGIVSFELAGSAEQAGRMIASWDATAQLQAAFSLGLDYLFMLVYGLTLWLGITLAAGSLEARGWPPRHKGWLLVWLAPLAIVCDAGENIFLILQLLNGPGDNLAWWAALLAIIKFAAIFMGLVFGFYGLVVALLVRLPAEKAGA